MEMTFPLNGDGNYGRPETGDPRNPSLLASMDGLTLNEATEVPDTTQDDFQIMVANQIPPRHVQWLNDFVRNPDAPLTRTVQGSSILEEVNRDAPMITVGITFLPGTDNTVVAQGELSRQSNLGPIQRSNEWKIFTASAIMVKIEVDEELRITRKDNTDLILNNYIARQGLLTYTEGSRSTAPADQKATKLSKINTQALTKFGSSGSQSIIGSGQRKQAFTIDSDNVKLLHGLPRPNEFEVTCTLVEIDMCSTRDLVSNYREIIRTGGRNISAAEIVMSLDTMINNVRQLCLRSPRLFWMSTRELITQSTDTRYGMDWDTQFITLITSESIRVLIERSSAYYLSLNQHKEDQLSIRSKFLQMTVMLVALLNNTDLAKISKLLESSFKIPGNRQDVEVLIMKTLPLQAVNAEVFMKGLYATYKPMERELSYDYQQLSFVWKKLMEDLAKRGYILPSPVVSTGFQSEAAEDDLDAQFDEDSDEDDDGAGGGSATRSWMMKWPNDGICSSTVFRNIQHDGRIRTDEDTNKTSIRAMNDIPYLDATPGSASEVVDVLFSNKIRYRIPLVLQECISTMKPGDYHIREIDSENANVLEVRRESLNTALIAAVRHMNNIVGRIERWFGPKKERWYKPGQDKGAEALVSIAGPAEAELVTADVVNTDAQNGPATRQRVAVAFKVASKVVFQDNLLGEMIQTIGKVEANRRHLTEMIARVRPTKSKTEQDRSLESDLQKSLADLEHVSQNIEQAKAKRADISKIRSSAFPQDPIKKVIFASQAQPVENRPAWEEYQITLSKKNENDLMIKGKLLTVEEIRPHTMRPLMSKVTFDDCSAELEVESVLDADAKESGPAMQQGDKVLWLGYYLVLVEGMKKSFTVQGYYKIKSQATAPSTHARKPRIGVVAPKVWKLI